MERPVGHGRPALRVLALAAAIAAFPLTGFAGEPTPSAARPGIRASAARVAATIQLEKQAQETPDRTQLNNTSFFKTPAGIAVIAVVAAGTGFAIYSARHDRIHSAVR